MVTTWTIEGARPLRGEVRLPGDKSVSHRALLLNAMAEGDAEVTGLNPGADVASTRACLRALGVRIGGDAARSVVHGRGPRWRPATRALDCGNSGTTMRLLAGQLAAQTFTSTLDGDESLRRRPMRRVAEPLRRLGARVEGPSNGERAPLIVTGGPLRGGRFVMPVASAQVKSCILLAAQAGGVAVEVEEPAPSRDHTERMLEAMGAELEHQPGRARLNGGQGLRALSMTVPRDPSSAALVVACALAVDGSALRAPGVLASPTRSGFVEVLARMGADVSWDGLRTAGAEPLGDLVVRSGRTLRATTVDAAEVPGLIDEVPALATLAATADGTTEFEGVGELRLKESDRIASLESLLRTFGIECGSEGDRFWVRGGRPRVLAQPTPSGDHRMAMATVALALAAQAGGSARCEVDLASAEVSFPGFRTLLEGLQRGH